VKFAGEGILSSKIHGITSERTSNDNHSENFKTRVYFVFSSSNKLVIITITVSAVLLLNFLTNSYLVGINFLPEKISINSYWK